MIVTRTWDEIWCESLEDLVLVRNQEETQTFRYVQVKWRAENQRWSPVSLTRNEEHQDRNGNTVRKSILVKLFEADKGLGESDFRLVINGFVTDRLNPILYRWKQVEPQIDLDSRCAQELMNGLGDWRPNQPETLQDYVRNFAIEQHPYTVEDMESAVHKELTCALRAERHFVLVDEVEEILWLLYREVFNAANAHPQAAGNPERISRTQFSEKLRAHCQNASLRRSAAASQLPSEALAKYLGPAELPEALVQHAELMRRSFVQLQRAENGTSIGAALDSAMDEVREIYTRAAVRYLSSPGTAREFLASILDEIARVHAERNWESRHVTLPTMQGMFYFMVARGTMPLCWDEG
jgi:hypothetical protein